MKNAAAVDIDHKTAEAAMRIGQETRAPMIAGSQCDLDRTEVDFLPVIQLMHDVEAEIMHQISDSDRDDDGLIGGNLAQRSPIEMVEMRVRHEHNVDLRKMMNF